MQSETSSRAPTPYERYLRENIEEEKRNLDKLYDEFAHSGPVGKSLIRRKIDETLQNIELLSQDLAKYSKGLSWLREPSKERDVKAKSLEKIQEEPQAKPVASGARAAPPSAQRPMVGTPRPSVGTPVGTPQTRPNVGTPAQQQTPPAASRPTVGTPVGSPAARPIVGAPAPTQASSPSPPRPSVGTPIETLTKKKRDEDKDGEKETKPSSETKEQA